MKTWITEWIIFIALRLLLLAKAIHPVMFETFREVLLDALMGKDLERYRKPVTSSNLQGK
jgi:hypothetical protein